MTRKMVEITESFSIAGPLGCPFRLFMPDGYYQCMKLLEKSKKAICPVSDDFPSYCPLEEAPKK